MCILATYFTASLFAAWKRREMASPWKYGILKRSEPRGMTPPSPVALLQMCLALCLQQHPHHQRSRRRQISPKGNPNAKEGSWSSLPCSGHSGCPSWQAMSNTTCCHQPPCSRRATALLPPPPPAPQRKGALTDYLLLLFPKLRDVDRFWIISTECYTALSIPS